MERPYGSEKTKMTASGMRLYRPTQPTSSKEVKRNRRRAAREARMQSELRFSTLSKVMILVSVNGTCLTIDVNNPDDMLADIVEPAVQILAASPVIECKPFRKDFLATLPADHPDPKQAVIDHVMEYLEKQHEKIEKDGRL